jgi:hypothetical protein
VNFFDADRLASEDRAEVDFFAAETDALAIGDDNGLGSARQLLNEMSGNGVIWP